MPHNIHHEHLIKELTEMLGSIFKKSPQAIYLYLDDEHKTCNKKFADLLGYSSVEEWIANPTPVNDVLKKDQEKVIKAYMDASRKLKASTLPATWKTKKGKEVKTQVTLVPIPYKNEAFVLHFISKQK